MADGSIDISDLPAPPAADSGVPDVSDLPIPTADTQTLGGFGQAVGTIPARAASDVIGMPVDALGNTYNLEQAAKGMAKSATTPEAYDLPPGEKLSPDGRAGVTPKGLYHYISDPVLDTEGNVVTPGVERYSPDPAPEGARPKMLPRKIDLPETIDTSTLPGSSENLKQMIRTLAGSNLVDVQERTLLNKYAATVGEGAAMGAITGGGGLAGAAKGAVGGGAASAAQQGGADLGLSDSATAAAGLLGGHAAGKLVGGHAAAPEKAPTQAAPADPVERILDTPDVVHEGSGAEGAPTIATAPAPSTASGAPRPQDGFVTDLKTKTTPHPTEPTQSRLGNVSIEAVPDPADPNTVHIQHFEADKPTNGQGTAAMQQLTDLADKHGVNLTLDSKPLAGDKPIPQEKLDQFYANHGFEPVEAGGTTMERPATGAKPGTSGIEVQEGKPLEPVGDADHPMRSGQPYSLISGERPGASPDENENRTKALGQMLQASGLKAAPTIGSNGGAPERSFAVSALDDAQRMQVENMGRAMGRDSVLHVAGDGTALQKSLAGEQQTHAIGKMSTVSQGDAEAQPGWTRDAQGNSYTVKPTQAVNSPPETHNGLGPEPEETMKTLFGGPAKDGSNNAESSAAGQQDRVDTFKKLGLTEVRKSAINGDYRAAGTEFQTSKLKGHPAGERIAGLIDSEHQALRNHAEDIVGVSGGSKGIGQTEMYGRGGKMSAPINGLHEHIEDAMNQAYEVAKTRAAGKPFTSDAFGGMLTNQKAGFLSTVEGKQLLEGVMARAGELGLTDKGSPVFKPATVEQAERMRQYLNDAWTPRTNKLIGQLKGALDQDVMRSAGQDLFDKARNARALMSKILEEPEGVSKLLQTKQANKLGINRQVDQEDVPGYVTKLPFDQFRQYVGVLKQAAAASPKLREQAKSALKETRGQFANEYLAAGDNQKGQWNQKGANNYLHANEMAMRYVYSPEEMQHFVDNDNAGRWLAMDRSYPGAHAQKETITQHLASLAAQHVPGPVVGGTVGGVLGHIPGAMAGAAASKGISAVANKLASAGAETLVQNLNDFKPPKETPVKKPNSTQRGSFSFENATPLRGGGSRNSQRGGAIERNPRTEYNANKQLAGVTRHTPEQEAMLARMSQ